MTGTLASDRVRQLTEGRVSLHISVPVRLSLSVSASAVCLRLRPRLPPARLPFQQGLAHVSCPPGLRILIEPLLGVVELTDSAAFPVESPGCWQVRGIGKGRHARFWGCAHVTCSWSCSFLIPPASWSFSESFGCWMQLGIYQSGLQSEGGAVDGGSIIL